jgi:dephospho-CoA kinase
MSKIIIGFVGQIACGKEVIKKYVAEKYNSKDCKFSSSLRDVLNRLNIEVTRENLQKVSTSLRSTFGEDLLAKAISCDASNLDSEVVIIDGVRRMSDIKYLKDLPNFYLIKVEADEKTRYERMKVRNENKGDSEKTFEQFLADQNNEAEKGIPEVMNFAKLSINNNGTLDELHNQTDKIIKNILKN